MSKKISQIYIDSAVDIRKRYIKSIEKLVDKETELENNRKLLEEIVEKVIKDESKDEDALKEKAYKIEKQINLLTSCIEPIVNEVDELRKESGILHNTIIEKYEGITEEEIKEQIVPHL